MDIFRIALREHTFLGGLDCTVLAGKEITGKSSDKVGGGEEVAGVLEAGVPFPPARIKQSTVTRKDTTGRHVRKRYGTYSMM